MGPWLVVGLGNPGPKYRKNRHNIGFWVAEALLERWRAGPGRDLLSSVCASAQVGSARVFVQKPQTYMNKSGHAVQRARQYWNVALPQIVVVHDEIDLPLGALRLKRGGGPGGHNGLRSVIAQLGDRDFLRVRLGVGHPRELGGDKISEDAVARYVLSDFPASVAAQVGDLVSRAADAVEDIVQDGLASAMNRHNQRVASETAGGATP